MQHVHWQQLKLISRKACEEEVSSKYEKFLKAIYTI
jgi:hypothetical protein